MKMTKEILEQWLDYRIQVYEAQHKHLELVWGKYIEERGTHDSGISACGMDHDKKIQLFISQYYTNTQGKILKEVADMLGVELADSDIEGYKQFQYKGYTFFVSVEYSEDTIEARKQYGLEV